VKVKFVILWSQRRYSGGVKSGKCTSCKHTLL
jgi:hypothetical protein